MADLVLKGAAMSVNIKLLERRIDSDEFCIIPIKGKSTGVADREKADEQHSTLIELPRSIVTVLPLATRNSVLETKSEMLRELLSRTNTEDRLGKSMAMA